MLENLGKKIRKALARATGRNESHIVMGNGNIVSDCNYGTIIMVNGKTIRDCSIKGNGNSVTRNIDIGAFSKIDIRGPFFVSFDGVPGNMCTIEIEENLFEHISFEYRNETLSVRIKESISPTKPIVLKLGSACLLDTIKLMDACVFEADCIIGRDLNCKISDAAELYLGELYLSRIDLHISDASKLRVKGTVNVIHAKVSDASSFKFKGGCDLLELHLTDASSCSITKTEKAEIHVRDASSLKIEVSQSLSGHVSDASSVRYSGISKADLRVSGASSAKSVD